MVDFKKLGTERVQKKHEGKPKSGSSIEEIRADLTPEQSEAFDEMINFMKSSDPMYMLGGYAGTGKTYTIVKLIKFLLSDRNGEFKIGMSAPTNKAVKVLRTFMSVMDKRVEFATIHSMLGLREKINFKGEQVFERDWKSIPTISSYNVLIIDESSMLSDELFDHIQDHIHDVKIIFMGDPAQIPPVNKEDSIPMKEKGRAQYGIGSYMLKNIVRQKEGNPLIETTLSIRENLLDTNCIRIPKVKQVNGQGVTFISSYDATDIRNLFSKYFVCDKFKKDADYAKVIAWTNRTVDYYNVKIRNLIYGEENNKVELGEKMIANTPIFDGEENIIFNTSDEFEVIEMKVETATVKGKDLKYYETKVGYHNHFTGNDMQKTIHILHEDSESMNKELLKEMMRTAKGLTPGSDMSRKAWVAFYKFKKVFADVKYAYAITAHKSQGSTYGNVVLIENDINFNKRVEERNRIKYTAASRPSENLYIIN